MACQKNHLRVVAEMTQLPDDQGGIGRHKCAACAYEEGFRLGQDHVEQINIEQILDSLNESQASTHRHKSPHAAFAKGYFDGVISSYSVQ